jgi:hypothetical protein
MQELKTKLATRKILRVALRALVRMDNLQITKSNKAISLQDMEATPGMELAKRWGQQPTRPQPSS